MKGKARKPRDPKPTPRQKQSAPKDVGAEKRHASPSYTGNDDPVTAALRGALTLVATPIGHAADITVRALAVLRAADIIFCEDTRQTQKLLGLHGIGGKKLIAAHEHNERLRAETILACIREGQGVVYVSDAGLPCISDPGQIIVQHMLQHGVPVRSLPGANAALTALQISGLPSYHFYFAGFLPPKSKARRDALDALKPLKTTLIFYEAPHRILDTLADMQAVLGNRPAALARELTKMYEEVRRGALSDIHKVLAAREAIKGEIVLVVGAFSDMEEEMMDQAEIDRLLLEARKTLSAREAAAIMSTKTGLPKRDLYQRLLHLNDKKKS